MPTNFPTSVDNFTNPTANDSLNLPSHSTQHANANDAIEAVEDYLLNGAGKSGLVHINSTTFTTSSGVQLDNVFSSTYDNYFFIFNLTATSVTNNAIRFRLVDGTTPQDGGIYNFAGNGVTTTNSITNATGSAQTSFAFLWADSSAADLTSGVLNVISPNKAQRTTVTFQTYNYNGVNDWSYSGAGLFNAATVLEGIRMYPTSGTISGTIRAYGYRNA